MSDEGANNLVYAIVMSAIKDYFSGDQRLKENAVWFLSSDMFVILTKGKIDPEDVLKKLSNSKRSDYFTPAECFITHKK